MFHCGDDLVGADLELQTDEAENLMALDCLLCDHRASLSALIANHCWSYAHGLMGCH